VEIIDALQIHPGYIFHYSDSVTHTYIARSVERYGGHDGVYVTTWCLTERDDPTRVDLRLDHGTKVMFIGTTANKYL
jgi:hypothetical protein